jgi:hypothetical protein
LRPAPERERLFSWRTPQKASRLASAKYITGCAAFGSTQDCAKELAPDEMSFASDRSRRKLTCDWFFDACFSQSWERVILKFPVLQSEISTRKNCACGHCQAEPSALVAVIVGHVQGRSR